MVFDDLVKIKSYFGLICSKVVLHEAHHVCVLVCNIVQGLMKSLVVVKVADAIHVGEVDSSSVCWFVTNDISDEDVVGQV